jgi:hypothetical protein
LVHTGFAAHRRVQAAARPARTYICTHLNHPFFAAHRFTTGLYKQLSILRDLLADVRGDPGSVHNLKDAIAGNVEASGLQTDCPLREGLEMSAEEAAAVEDEVRFWGSLLGVSLLVVWHFQSSGKTG